MKNIEKGRETEERMKAHIEKYPLTPEEAFEKADQEEFTNSVIEGEGLSETISVVNNDLTLANAIYDSVGGEPYVWSPAGSKFKKIDEELYAYEIDTVGCIVNDGTGIVFIPEVNLVKGEDGTFDLIRGRKFRG